VISASARSVPILSASSATILARLLGLLVDGEPQSQAELGVVLEQRVVPGRAAPFGLVV
jgi:hypothetical protein